MTKLLFINKSSIQYILLLFFCISFIFPNNSFSAKQSYGFGTEAAPLSLISLSLSLNYNEHEEIFSSIGTAIFGGSISIGYKYRKNEINKSSLYTSICLHTGIYSDMLNKITAIYPSLGYSIKISKKTKLNIGAGYHFALKNVGSEFDGKKIFFTPFFNLTVKR